MKDPNRVSSARTSVCHLRRGRTQGRWSRVCGRASTRASCKRCSSLASVSTAISDGARPSSISRSRGAATLMCGRMTERRSGVSFVAQPHELARSPAHAAATGPLRECCLAQVDSHLADARESGARLVDAATCPCPCTPLLKADARLRRPAGPLMRVALALGQLDVSRDVSTCGVHRVHRAHALCLP